MVGVVFLLMIFDVYDIWFMLFDMCFDGELLVVGDVVVIIGGLMCLILVVECVVFNFLCYFSGIVMFMV